jgi:hypothetical protein
MKIHPFAHICLIFFILFFCRITANSQEPAQDTASVDFLFQKARNLAFNGKRTEARSICRQILLKSPDYEDVRVLGFKTRLR